MNRTLLLIIVDFLFLNLIALTRWEKAEPVSPRKPPVTELASNAATKDQDLLAAMKDSLADERQRRDELAQQLTSVETNLDAKTQALAKLEGDRAALSSALAASRQSAQDLGRKYEAATEQQSLTQDQLAQIKRQLEDKLAEAERQRQAIALLEQKQSEAQRQIENLRVSVGVAEHEKESLKAQTVSLESQVQTERTERLKVEQATSQLASGVGQLAASSGALTQEIRDNRPINANVLFSDFLASRVQTTFMATRPGLFGKVNRTKNANTLFVTDGKQVYALLHVEDTIFSFWENSSDWDSLTVAFDRPGGYHSNAPSLSFLAADPRVVVVPVDADQVTSLGVKVYPLAADPFKFPEAVLISGGGRGYGEVGFKLDPDHPGYVKVDNRLMKRLFGDFAPSRGDLVISESGGLLGVMVTSDYCVLIRDFSTIARIPASGPLADVKTGLLLDSLIARIKALPLPLQ